MKKIYRLMLNQNTNRLFIFLFFTMLISNVFFGFFTVFFNKPVPSSSNAILEYNTFQIISSIVIAPLLETAIAQKMIIGFSRTYIKNNLICIAISAVLFGLGHYDSVTKIFQTMFMGFYLGLFYMVLKKKGAHAFYLTALLHGFWNLFAIIIINISEYFSI